MRINGDENLVAPSDMSGMRIKGGNRTRRRGLVIASHRIKDAIANASAVSALPSEL